MINDPTGGLGGTQDPNDPYSTAGLKYELLEKIKAIIKDLKTHPGDMTQAMNNIFGDMQKIQGLLVGQSSETQSGLTTAITGIANLQKYGADKDGTPVQDINIFTGQPKVGADGKAVMVSPERAFRDESMFLLNSPNTRDKLDKNGKRIPSIGADGKPIYQRNKDGTFKRDAQGNKIPEYVENPMYKFAHTKGNESVAAQLQSAVEGAITSLASNKGSGKDFTSTVSDGAAGYTENADGQVEVDDNGVPTDGGKKVAITGDTKGSDGKYPKGAIQNMWDLTSPSDPSKNPPDSSVLNSFQSAMGTLGQAGTASSSTLQAYIKVLTDNLTASQGNYNKALTATISQLKVMVQAQKTGG